MFLGATWDDSYLQHKKKEQSSGVFIYQSAVSHQNLARDLTNGPWCTLVQILSTTKNKGTVFCDVYTSIFSNKVDQLP